MRQVAASRSPIGWQILIVLITGLALISLTASMPPLLIVGAMATALLGLVFLQRPDLGLLFLLLARASTDATLGSFAGALGARGGVLGLLLSPNTTLILMVIVVGGVFLLSRSLPFISLPAGRAFTLLLLVGFVGVLRASSFLGSLNEWLPAVSALIIYALAANLFRDPRRLQTAIDVLAISFLAPAVLGLYQLATAQGRLLAPGITRIHGTFVHPNPFAVYLLIIISVFLCQMLVQRRWRRWLALSIVLAASALLVGTYTRSVWIGAAVVLGVVGMLRERRLLLLAPILAGIVYIAIPSIGARLENPLGGSFAARVDLWKMLIDEWMVVTSQNQGLIPMILDRFTGLGPGSYAIFFPQSRVILPHNDYLRILVEYGAFGLVLFGLMYVAVIRMGYQAWRHGQGQGAALPLSFLALAIAYPVMSITDNLFAMTVNQAYFWALAGLVAACTQPYRPEGQSLAPESAWGLGPKQVGLRPWTS